MSAIDTAPKAAGTGARKLEGRVALVTGGIRGIGAAITQALAGEGAAVAAGYSSNRDKAEAFQSELASKGTTISIHQGNIASYDDCARTVSEVIERHGRLDILVNNAGITNDMPMLKMSAEDWTKVINVNLNGAFYMSKPSLGHMIERGSGRIINISSVIGQQGNIGQANYAAAKSGMFGLSMTMAREAAWALGKSDKLHEDGVGLTVNAVAPGYIATEMVEAVPEKVLNRIKGNIPLARLGRPEEVARVVLFLAEDDSSYITGQVFAVNGGMEM
jgi:NAD(P)-dependent dehydrogenase (short-subunit alcohol dehydrogenase family)